MLVLCAGLFLLSVSSAFAGPPVHPRLEARDVPALNHACGAAVDSEGDLYLSSAGDSEIRIYNASHALVLSIPNANEPCALAVDTGGKLYVTERATGKVIRYTPTAYPPTPSTTYTEATIDASGNAKGIAVDLVDNRLYVAEGTHIAIYKGDGSFETNVGEPALLQASGVAAYTSQTGDRYLVVADAQGVNADELLVFSASGSSGTPPVTALALRREVDGAATPDGSFDFGGSEAYIAADPGNAEAALPHKCVAVGNQACTAGHVLLYDAGHEVLDEFEATGEYLDQMEDPAFAPAKPNAVTVDRSGGAGDGQLYLTVGEGAGAKALAFGPLAQSSRELDETRSHVLPNAHAVTTDAFGDVYAAAGSFIHVYSPQGTEITSFEDTNTPLRDLAVDSECHVYVLEKTDEQMTYYSASACPPTPTTTFTRHEPVLAEWTEFPAGSRSLRSIAVDPGPGAGRDRLFLATINVVRIYKSAKEGSEILDPNFAGTLSFSFSKDSIAIEGASERYNNQTTIYFGLAGTPELRAVNGAGTEFVARIDGSGCPEGKMGAAPQVAVDQSNGHVLTFQAADEEGHEFERAGACVAEFGQFTNLVLGYGIAVDSACSTHVNPSTGEEEPLDETTTPTCAEFDPADGTAYVAYDDTAPGSYDLTAFEPLSYGGPPDAVTEPPGPIGGGEVIFNGTVNPKGFEVSECTFQYLEEDDYIANGKTFAGAASAPCEPSAAALGEGKAPLAVHAPASIDTEAHWCVQLLAANEFGPDPGGAICFGPPLAETLPARPVAYTGATLRAQVDPSGLSTTYRFAYGLEGNEYEHVTAPHPLAPGAGPSEVSVPIGGLSEGTTYHFQVLVENEAAAVQGGDESFTTQVRRAPETCPNGEYRGGLSARLPDCRAYELVTPAASNGLRLLGIARNVASSIIDGPLTPPRGPGAGGNLSYFVNGTLPGFDGNGIFDAYNAARAPGDHPTEGWVNRLFSPTYKEAEPGLSAPLDSEGISPDQLYSIWNVHVAESFAELSDGAYLRGPDGAANPQCLAGPPPAQLDFELLGCGSLGTDPAALGHYLADGGAHVIFSSSAHLEEAAPPASTRAIYDRLAGSNQADVISVKPDGTSFGAGEGATYLGSSEAGDAVVFRTASALYERRAGETVQVAAAPFAFAGVFSDGGRVFYATTADGSTAAPLYACDTEVGPCAGPGAQEPESIGPPGTEGIFANVSADGSRAFFTSTEALTGSEENDNGEVAEPGARNLYAFDLPTDATSFIARLAPEDFESDAFGGVERMNMGIWSTAVIPDPDRGLGLAPTRSTPDGGVLVFQSHARLSPYENEGVGEIYRYDPAAPPGERLTCPSCDPSGAPPSADGMLQDLRVDVLSPHAPLANLTDEGTALFFTSPDRLLPEDANAAIDVYEWRALGSSWGTVSGAPQCQRPGGCLALISSGQGERDSVLFAMSADGHDVFIHTLERLVGADVIGSNSLYDAREGGGIPEPEAPVVCSGDACQPEGAPPLVLAAPASTGAEGGNVTGNVKKGCPKGKRRVKGRCVKPRHHKRHRRHRGRRGR